MVDKPHVHIPSHNKVGSVFFLIMKLTYEHVGNWIVAILSHGCLKLHKPIWCPCTSRITLPYDLITLGSKGIIEFELLHLFLLKHCSHHYFQDVAVHEKAYYWSLCEWDLTGRRPTTQPPILDRALLLGWVKSVVLCHVICTLLIFFL